MKLGGNNRFRVAGASFLMVLFLSLWCSSNLFFHTHIVNNQLITHSHFSSEAGHSHSGAEFTVISMLSLSLALMAGVILLLSFGVKWEKSKNFQNFNTADLYTGSIRSLRAPPAGC
ncbi:MAG: hypothetical protein J6S16_05010 [Bacteroidales bacterium]|nr:hypothetical protein [Bacteroidales bacterium]MBO7321572.1 hypothetical protein [Bacteroidales bacterium]MBO7764284.1 hypothetical protein [Bacteroidales bacterium]